MFGDCRVEFATADDAGFVGQERGWDCGLAAFRACYRHRFGLRADLSFRGWLRTLRELEIARNDYGVPLPGLARLAWVFDMRPQLVLGPIYPDPASNREGAPRSTRVASFLQACAAARVRGIPVHYFKRQSTVARHLHVAMENHEIILLEVHCTEYYRIAAEDWSHYIALLKGRDKWKVIDPLRYWGEKEYGCAVWATYLFRSFSFRVDSGSGGFVALG